MADPWADFIPKAPTAAPAPAADPWADFIPAKPSVAMDVAKSVVPSVGRGIISTLTAPRDMWDGASHLTTYGTAWAAEKLGLLPKGKTADDFMEAARNIDKPRVDTPKTHPTDDPGVLARTARTLDQFAWPSAATVQKEGVEPITGKFYEPQTTAGKYAKTGIEFATGARLTGAKSLWDMARFGLLPGLASEGSGQMAEYLGAGTVGQTIARVAGGLGTGVGLSMASAPNIATRKVADATRGASDQQITAAAGLMQEAQSRGVTLTWPEALQQITGGATQAGRLQRVIEGTNEGSGVLLPIMAQRPEQITRAVGGTLDNIAPAAAPTQTGINAQKAAQGGIHDLRQKINAAEAPYYDAARMQSAPPQNLQFISQDPVFHRALENVRGDAIRNKDVASYGANDVATLIAVRKEMARMEQAAMNPGAGQMADTELARNITPVRDRLDQIITQTAPEYGQGLGVGAGLRETQLDPLVAGPLGKVAATDDLGAQVKALYPTAPMEGTAAETAGAIGRLNAQDATVAPALTRQHLAANFAEASQNNVPGANQWGGAKFAAQVAGNPLQRQVLMGNVGALPNGAAQAENLSNLIQVLEATGKRQQPGSLTAFNTNDLKDLASSGALGAATDVARTGNPLTLSQRLGEALDRRRLGKRSEAIAKDMVADPQLIAAILMGARTAAPQGRAAAELARIINGSNSVLRLPGY